MMSATNNLTMVEINGNLIEHYDSIKDKSSKPIIIHCISNDFALGAGIAKQLDDRFHIKDIRQSLIETEGNIRTKVGDAYTTTTNQNDIIINLITKERYFHKPTYKTMELCLQSLNNNIIKGQDNIKIFMPRIGCGLDRLDWYMVSELIKENISNADITVFYL